ncbi:glutaredoxin family protein [Rhodococcus ruber]|uniref:glutaredoxin family protein n=1 Tax=Rhodococcus ruber TaxID=1830 RepID=UPI003783DDAC
MNPVPITVYGRPAGCPQCDATKRHLDKQGTPYTFRNVDTDTQARDTIVMLGYQGVPVVSVGDMHWQGYRPDKLNALQRLHTVAADITELDAAAETYLADTEAAA